MKQSLVRKIIILASSILVTSILFFAAISFAYNYFYKENVLDANDFVSYRWTADIDHRLDNIYEHLYDLAATLYNKTPVRPGSPEMDYTIMQELQDTMTSKAIASPDTTVLFVLDIESSLYLYYHNSALNQTVNNNLKLFLQQHCLDHHSSINNRVFDVVSILENVYYYKALTMGKYIVGAVSSADNYYIDPSWISGNGPVTSMIYAEENYYLCQGDPSLIALADTKERSFITDGYAVSSAPQKYAHAMTILINKPLRAAVPWRLTSAFMIIDSAICVFLVFLLIHSLNREIRIPVRELVKADQEVAKGDFDYRLDPRKAGSSEFEELYRSFNDMSGKIETLTIESYDNQIRREQNRLKMLRAQMRPHTFLNGLTTISNMTYTARPEDMRRYISSFASFARYMLHTTDDWTTIGEEIRHIENYTELQKTRQPGSVELTYDCAPEVLLEKIPYLTLFSLVENSFKHALTLQDTLRISIRGECYEEEGFRGTRLIEEDNGPGFSEIGRAHV